MYRLTILLSLLSVVTSTHSRVISTAQSARHETGLNNLAKARGKFYFGSATDNPELTDEPYVAILSDRVMFGQVTPANSMKWDASEPEQGVFNFTGGNQIADLAKHNGQLLRGHNCVWHNQLPTWVTNGTFTAPELTKIIQQRCSTLVTHWPAFAWDIVNEPFNEDGTFGENVFFNVLGEDYIPIALKAARRANSGVRLYINEFNIEFAGPKATAMMNLIKKLKKSGVPIDGVGLQCHFIVGEIPTDLQQIMGQFAELGIEVAITELDVRMTLPATDALLAQQKADYESVVSACVNTRACVGVTVWGNFTDKFSWIPGAFAGMGAACPWDENLKEKPAFDGIVSALRA